MFVIFSYLVFVIRKIYIFFNLYVTTGNFTYKEEMAFNYVPIYLFLLIIIILIGTVFIYFLMKRKEKPILFYQGLIVYTSVLLILFIYLFSFFSSLDRTTYEPLRIVVNRDIVLFIYIINFFYVGFSFVRGFGFDIKKFSFEHDKKELNTEESDNEEFELNIDIDQDKVVRNIRREKRELKYYIKENKQVFTIILIVLFVGIGIYGYIYFFVTNRIYHEEESIEIANISYSVNKSYLTTLDKYSNPVSSSYKFVLVKLNISNLSKNVNFSREKFRIQIGDSYYYPVYNFYDSFNDLGQGYKEETIKKGSDREYLFVFKIPREKTGRIYFEILKNSNRFLYDKILLETEKDNKISKDYALNEEFTVNEHTLKIKNYDLVDSTSYMYKECIETEQCNIYTKSVIPNNNSVVLVLDIENSSSMENTFFENYLWFYYADKEISSKNIKLLSQNEDVLYFQVPISAKTAYDYEIVIKTRSVDYHIDL